MQKVKSLFILFLYFTVFTILGFGIGYGVAILNHEGMFASWQQLDSSQKFKKIIDVTSQSIWAQTLDEKLYSWDTNCYRNPNYCNQWVETKEIPDDIHNDPEQPMIKDDSCQFRGFKFSGKPRGNLVECAQGSFLGFDSGTTVYYALLDDGTIWIWKISGSTLLDLFLIILFSLGGFVFGIIAFVIQRLQKNKIQTIKESNL